MTGEQFKQLFKSESAHDAYLNHCREESIMIPHSGYFEHHHIIPRSFFANKSEADFDGNIVQLSFKNHAIAHLLLADGYEKSKNAKHPRKEQVRRHLRLLTQVQAPMTAIAQRLDFPYGPLRKMFAEYKSRRHHHAKEQTS